VIAGRVSRGEALALIRGADLFALGRRAHELRLACADPATVTYLVDRNINYTNACITDCKFCAFYRPPGDPEAYVLDREVIGQKIKETLQAGGTRILLQGGHNPALRIGWYEDLLRWIKASFGIHLDAFSPSEIDHLATLEGMPVRDVLARLRDAGMDGLPGGGAEILHDEVRAGISPRKLSARGWLDIMREAQRLGMVTSATMVIGCGEAPEHRVAHLMAIRDLQDETGGFSSFIPWTMQVETSAMGKVFATQGLLPASAQDYLATVALSRILLDNIPHIGASWPTQGEKVAQTALAFGADDFGSTMLEENVVSAAGTTRIRMDVPEIHHHIRTAGYVPAQRDSRYRILNRFGEAAA
jgi:cyclic dehypoxanthinyl futalosine synthase